jgi:MFS family permease
VAPIAGALADRIGTRALIAPGLALQGSGFAWIVSLAGRSAPYSSFVVPFVIAGVGISMALPAVTATGLNAAPPSLLGKAAGSLNTMQQFGAVFGIAITTAVFNGHGSLAGPSAVTDGYQAALAAAAGLSGLGALVALSIRSGCPAAVAQTPIARPTRRAAVTAVPSQIDYRSHTSQVWADPKEVLATDHLSGLS